jgi:hypothetical protein
LTVVGSWPTAGEATKVTYCPNKEFVVGYNVDDPAIWTFNCDTLAWTDRSTEMSGDVPVLDSNHFGFIDAVYRAITGEFVRMLPSTVPEDDGFYSLNLDTWVWSYTFTDGLYVQIDPETQQFIGLGTYGYGAVVYDTDNDQMWAIGGAIAEDAFTDSTCMLDFATAHWTQMANIPSTDFEMPSVWGNWAIICNGRIISVGGTAPTYPASAYDIDTDTWSEFLTVEEEMGLPFNDYGYKVLYTDTGVVLI